MLIRIQFLCKWC